MATSFTPSQPILAGFAWLLRLLACWWTVLGVGIMVGFNRLG